jgi:hypothetical protein
VAVNTAARTITIDIDRCLTNEFFTVSYAGVAPGSISLSPYTFMTYTDIGPGGGGVTLITAPSPSVTIDPKALTVSAAGLTPGNKTYDKTTDASLTKGSPTLLGVISPDVVTLDTTGATASFADWNVGNAKPVAISGLALGGADAANYTLTPPTRSANILPRPVTINAVTDNKQYDGNINSIQIPTISVDTPLVAGDTALGLTQDFANKNAGSNKVIAPTGVIQDGNGGANYVYTFTPVSTGVITKRPITVTAATESRVYDGTTASSGRPTLSPLTPLAPGDTEPVWTQTFDTAAVGTSKQLTPAGAVIDGNSGNNYAYTFVPDLTGAISARKVTISADAKTKIIGTADPVLTYHATAGSLAAGDTLALVRAPGEVLGPHPITIASFPAASNYDLTYNGANLTIVPAPVHKSAGAYDGWVLESTPTSNVGGFMNSTGTTFQLGDDAANRQYRAILSFNTSGLPDNAVITKAVLKIKQYGAPTGLNPFTYFGGLLVDARKGTFGMPGLAIGDFQAAPSALRVTSFNKVPSAGWYSATLNLAGRNNINRTGITQFRLYFTKGDNANLKADFMKFVSGNSTVGQPQLIITYTLP